MKCLLLCVVVCLSWSAFAQNLQPSTNEKSLPDSASTSKAAAENSDMAFVVRPVPIRPPTLRIEAGPTAERRHVADRKFLIASLFQIGATVCCLPTSPILIVTITRSGMPGPSLWAERFFCGWRSGRSILRRAGGSWVTFG